MTDPNLMPAHAFRRGFRTGYDYAAWNDRTANPDTRPDTCNPYFPDRDESNHLTEPIHPTDEPVGVILYAPHPQFPDVPAEVIRTENGHISLVLFPWADDDDSIVKRQLSELLDMLLESFPGLKDPRT